MGLFGSARETFLSLDQSNREYLGIRLPTEGLSAKNSTRRLARPMREEEKPSPDIALAAWGAENERSA